MTTVIRREENEWLRVIEEAYVACELNPTLRMKQSLWRARISTPSGWIAALPVERAAATALLDERHDEPHDFSQHPSDTNSYTWGRMGKHSVVIASLAAGVYGATSTAITVSSLLSSLPQIRIGLLVGIGGGIARPNEGTDIRLGDVVVSQPHGVTGGVVQYDLAKAKPNSTHERKDSLNMPLQVLLDAATALRADYYIVGSKVSGLLEEMWKANPRMAKPTRSAPGFVHQGFDNDRLFDTSCHHAGGRNCGSCDPNGEVHRDARDSADPEVHFGIIASGNTLVKDAATRDQIVEYIGGDCLCVEMEAARLMNHFPCLVVQGICDYADSHKNDRWQCYAYATAAAFGKELLSYVPVKKLQETQRAAKLLQSIKTKVQDIHSMMNHTKAGVDSLKLDSHLDKLKKWLSPPDPSTNLNTAKEKRHKGTGDWFINSNAFLEWKSGPRRHLWLHGLAGCGKTVITSTILDHLHLQDTQTDSCVCLNFFFDFRDKDKQRLDNLLRSPTFQLYSRCIDSQKELDSLFTSHEDGQEQPTTESLSKTIHLMMQRPEKLQIILDALDECTTRSELLKWMESSSELTSVHLIATSRREDELESGLSGWIDKENVISMDRDLVNEDIRSYTKVRLQVSKEFQKRWDSRPNVLEEIESVIGKKSSGMFRWAACQLDDLEKCSSYRANIPDEHREETIQLLQFLAYSERPLTIEEAVDAMAVDLENDHQFDAKDRLPCPMEITRFGSSLVSLFERESNIELELAHFSVKEYLTTKALPEPFQYEMSEGIARRRITKICLAHLSCLNNRQSVAEITTLFPQARYSAKYWMDHAKQAKTWNDVRKSIMDFFKNDTAYTTWGYLFNPDKDWDKHPIPNTIRPLYLASLKGLNTAVQMLLKKGADVNAQGGKYGNALHAASAGGYDKIAWILLEKGADVNAQGGGYGNALQATSIGGYDKVVQMLLEKGADVNAQGGGGYDKIVQILFEKGADMNAQGGGYGNALQAASTRGYDKVVQILLEKGANMNTQGGKYGNALQAASTRGYDKIVQILLEKGADVNTQGGWYGNALQAASTGGHDMVVQIMLETGADMNIQDSWYGNALHAASDV
ncbi:Pfs, NACHT and ankyrin domain protein [Lasiosphaeria miniovina]|uniref:Pfs, NACHT and ankyrin domain protein n=1 Tax=Lasiosphaeria miniovina TaxID=1954250 RepID=A0AA40ABB0_9PEZI|nr:Pfs, NACHT and ankyrin domain protein [Lasiosphaeria miniovina]KAK0712676.1 Pfs, NACHT and ankyrin domain protein [Lasiosphaeria miniovina]